MAWFWVSGRIAHYGIKLYCMVFGMKQHRALWYKLEHYDVGMGKDRALWYVDVWHGVGYWA